MNYLKVSKNVLSVIGLPFLLVDTVFKVNIK